MKRKADPKRTITLTLGLMAVYALVVQAQPNDRYAQVFYQMGEDCERNHCPVDRQIALAEKVVHHDPTFSRGLSRLGAFHFKQGRLDEARRYHQLALLYDHKNWTALLQMGNYYRRHNDLDRALRFLKHAHASVGEDENLHYSLARTYEARGDDKQAAWHYLRAYQYNPDNLTALARLGAVSFRGGDKQSCLEYIERIRGKGNRELADELAAYVRSEGKAEFLASQD